jgi:hypothetical protein
MVDRVGGASPRWKNYVTARAHDSREKCYVIGRIMALMCSRVGGMRTIFYLRFETSL